MVARQIRKFYPVSLTDNVEAPTRFGPNDRHEENEDAAVKEDGPRNHAQLIYGDQTRTLRTFREMRQRDIVNNEGSRSTAEQDGEGEGQTTVMGLYRAKGLDFLWWFRWVSNTTGAASGRITSSIPNWTGGRREATKRAAFISVLRALTTRLASHTGERDAFV